VIARCDRGYGLFDLDLVRNIALTSLPTGSDRSADGFIQSRPLSRAAALPNIARKTMGRQQVVDWTEAKAAKKNRSKYWFRAPWLRWRRSGPCRGS